MYQCKVNWARGGHLVGSEGATIRQAIDNVLFDVQGIINRFGEDKGPATPFGDLILSIDVLKKA